MGLILSLLTKLDAAVQRRFDSICFFLMSRFGVRKSTIRYTILAFCATSLASMGVLCFAVYQQPLLGAVALTACAALLIFQHRITIIERRDERWQKHVDTCGAIDAKLSPVFKALGLLEFLAGPLAAVELPALLCLCQSTFGFGIILFGYLIRTPMNPPAEKAREHVGTLRPASAET